MTSLINAEHANGLTVRQAEQDGSEFVIGLPSGEHILLDKSEIRWLYDETHKTVTRHRMTSGLVNILTNVARTVHEKNENNIHLYKDVTEVCGPQAYSQLSNITKLRFHALVFKVKDEDGKHIKGRWGITKRGGQFLRGEVEIPEYALTKDNKVVGREGKLIGIRALRPEGPVEFEQREDITYTSESEIQKPHVPQAVSWLHD